MSSENEEKKLLPHHKQLPLCVSRLPYRQGRILTAVKVYSINNESNHLLVFGVPSLKLRQETKALLSKFGKLKQFVLTKDHPGEEFTETYHAIFEEIQSARLAKKLVDTKNFYGGLLHVSYAPEFETVDETRKKIMQRRRDVIFRLKKIEKESRNKSVINEVPLQRPDEYNVTDSNLKLNMGEVNVINIGNNLDGSKRQRKKFDSENVTAKKFKPCFITHADENVNKEPENKNNRLDNTELNNIFYSINNSDNIEIVNCTSTETDVITNINECLNYNNFGNEIIRKVPERAVNKIKFNLNSKKLK